MSCGFTWDHYKDIFKTALENDYKFVTCVDYVLNHEKYENEKIFINRVDVDLSCKKAKIAAEIFKELNINASFFIRLHADYNPFSFENYECLRFIRNNNNEIGLHSEIMDCEGIWNELSEVCLIRDLKVLSNMLNVGINGVASHRGYTKFNNLDFWKESFRNSSVEYYALLYEAYDSILFNNFFMSDSQITKWKCYNNGRLIEGNEDCACKNIKRGHRVIYCLTHPCQYYYNHPYES